MFDSAHDDQISQRNQSQLQQLEIDALVVEESQILEDQTFVLGFTGRDEGQKEIREAGEGFGWVVKLFKNENHTQVENHTHTGEPVEQKHGQRTKDQHEHSRINPNWEKMVDDDFVFGDFFDRLREAQLWVNHRVQDFVKGARLEAK